MRTHVYIDGFNLYYGAVRGTPFKWLDVLAMCRRLLPRHRIDRIKYFTADISALPWDREAPNRQQVYLRALRTIGEIEIIKGHFLLNTVLMPRADGPPTRENRVRVLKMEEKGSDVNLATHLLVDGFTAAYEQAVVVSDDSDLLAPIKVVRERLRMPIGILNPRRSRPSKVMTPCATFFKRIRPGVLRDSQFPDQLTDSNGRFRKPESW